PRLPPCTLFPYTTLFRSEAAIGYAADGVPVSRSLLDWLVQDVPVLTRFPETAAIFLPGGRVPAEGQRLAQPALARSLREIAEKGDRKSTRLNSSHVKISY